MYENLADELINRYVCGESTVQIGKYLSMSPSSVRNVLVRNGVKMRSNKDNSRRYQINHDFFEHIDTEEKAYWLGMTFSDGYITSNNHVGISLKSNDYEHLVKLNKSLDSDYPIHVYTSETAYGQCEYARVVCTSKKMQQDLLNNGLSFRKSRILLYPDVIDQTMERHFIRGYVDGDGCIGKNGESFYFGIMGTRDFNDGVSAVFERDIDVLKHSVCQRHSYDAVVDYRYFGADANKIISYLYENANIYLERKYQRYQIATQYFSRLYQK